MLASMKHTHVNNGRLAIINSGTVSNVMGYIADQLGSMGEVAVDGVGSTWANSSSLYIGSQGSGTLTITNGGVVSNHSSTIALSRGSTGVVTVSGAGSAWKNNGNLSVGYEGSGTLAITNGGLVSVFGTLNIEHYGVWDGSINMASGGMLAIKGSAADSLNSFLDLIDGTDAIRYWDYSNSDWADIMEATYGEDYSLTCPTYGEDYSLTCPAGYPLYGYTVLTVSMPESTLPGDANCDGKVDDADVAVLAKYWQTDSVAFWGMGDFNGDNAVDDLDATLLAANFQSGSSVNVPEPSTLIGLLGVCLVGLLASTRCK